MRFVRDPRGLVELELLARPELERRAKRAAEAARVIGESIRLTGAYAKSIDTDGTRLVSLDPFAHLVEFGSVNNPVHAPLRKAAEQVGAKVRGDA